jgi:hypothetical protein
MSAATAFVQVVEVELCGQIRRLLKAGDLAVVRAPRDGRGVLEVTSFSRGSRAGSDWFVPFGGVRLKRVRTKA